MKLVFTVLAVVFATISYSQDLLTPEKLWEMVRVSAPKISPNGKYMLYSQTTYDVAANKGNADLYIQTLDTREIIQLTNTSFSEYEAQWSSSNVVWFLSTETGNMEVWKINPDGTGKTQLSNFGENEIEGFKVAPDESSIITLEAVKMKETVNDIYADLPKANVRIEDDLMYRHWDHWDDYKKRHVFVHTIANGKIVKEGKDLLPNEPFDAMLPPFGGMEQLTFTPDSKSVVYTSKKLQGKDFAQSTNSSLYWVDIATGNTRNLLPTGHEGYDVNPSFSVNKDLAWLSMKRNGYEADKNDIIVKLYKTDTEVNLTAKLDLSVSDYSWHPDGTRIYFLAAKNATVQIFEVFVLTGQIRQITTGQHDYTSVVPSGDYVFAGRQSMIHPVDIYAVQIAKIGKSKKMDAIYQLTDANKELMASLKAPIVKEKWMETSDGKKMLTWMILPPDFDSTKQYPTLLYCQGGPQSPVSQFFSYRWNFMLMASQGYIVVAPNRRGLPGFGVEWNEAISKDWGGQPMRDYLTAIDEASKESYVDKNRLGAIGASYGGYSVYYLAGIHEKRFKTFVSHCGLFNLESWYGTTEELFFANWDIGGPYWKPENKELYEKNSPHKLVQNWDTPILVIHGGKDFRVPESEGMQAFQAAQLLGLKSKYLYFPEEGHWVLKPQNGLVWHREFFKWLDSDLKTK